MEVQTICELLQAHQRPAVTLMTQADLAVAFDFYSLPPDHPGSDGRWQRTPAGELIHRAKYWDDVGARKQIAATAVEYVATHPLLREAKLFAAMPGHDAGPAKHNSIARVVTDALVSVGARWRVDLQRTRSISRQFHERSSTNAGRQQGTMAAQRLRGGSVLVIDDAIRDGETLTEACRALRSAGASRVYSLVVAKDWRGTRGYRKDDL